MKKLTLACAAALAFVPPAAAQYGFEGFSVRVKLSEAAAEYAATHTIAVSVAWVGELKEPRPQPFSEDLSLTIASYIQPLDLASREVTFEGRDVSGSEYLKVKENTLEVRVFAFSANSIELICDAIDKPLAEFDAAKGLDLSCRMQSES